MAKGYLQDVEIVDFYNRPIVTAFSDEIGYVVPMKHIIEEHLGLDWKKMKKKMRNTVEVPGIDGLREVNLFNPVIVSGYDLSRGLGTSSDFGAEEIPVFSPNADYLCLPVAEINLFLAQISINHVHLEVRENLYQYQKECGSALHDYWFRGLSVNGRKDPSRISSERHEWCPRELTTKSLLKSATRYSAFAERVFDSRMDPADIHSFANNAIASVLNLEEDTWSDQTDTVAFLIAFMERAAFDILYFSIEGNVPPENLQDVIERNLNNAWENMGSLIISVQSPYNPFPGIGRGASRELV